MRADNYLEAKDTYFALKDMATKYHNLIEENKNKPFMLQYYIERMNWAIDELTLTGEMQDGE